MITRPRIFDKPEQIQKLIDEYFQETASEDITITGLCLHIGIHKDTFYEYGKRKAFAETIRMARMRVENAYEISLRHNGRAGDIFALKNFGWRDKQEVDTNIKGDFGDQLGKLIDKL